MAGPLDDAVGFFTGDHGGFGNAALDAAGTALGAVVPGAGLVRPAAQTFGGGNDGPSASKEQKAALDLVMRIKNEYPGMTPEQISAGYQIALRQLALGTDESSVIAEVTQRLEAGGLTSQTAGQLGILDGTASQTGAGGTSGGGGLGFSDLINDPKGFLDSATQQQAAGLQQLVKDNGLLFRGFTEDGSIIALDPVTGEPSMYRAGPGGTLQFITSDPKKMGGKGSSGSGGGGGGNKQNIGVDKDGFALIFDPATGAITKGPQVGFGQIDPRVTAAEDARRFNEQQGLREGEFMRDVLANGRNFLTAAALTRGGAQSFTTGTTQGDLLRTGGVDMFAASGGIGTPGQTAGFMTGTPGGMVRPGEVDPNTLSRPSQQFGTSSTFATGNKPGLPTKAGGFDSSNLAKAGSLGAMALAFAPPAVKDIAAGKTVGGLSTPGSIKLANPQTLANLTPDEQGALDTTLQNVDQRTFGEFKQESDQRFRGQGSRRATRSR